MCYYINMENPENSNADKLRDMINQGGMPVKDVIDIVLESGKVTPEFAEGIVRRLLELKLVAPEGLARITDIRDSVASDVTAVGRVEDRGQADGCPTGDASIGADIQPEKVKIPELSEEMVELGKHISKAFQNGVGLDALNVARKAANAAGCSEAKIDWMKVSKRLPALPDWLDSEGRSCGGDTVSSDNPCDDYLIRVEYEGQIMLVAPQNIPNVNDIFRYYFVVQNEDGINSTREYRNFWEMIRPCQIDVNNHIIRAGALLRVPRRGA